MKSSTYVGRFAPSPSGPLHLGSLVCALASYLDAKQNNGIWFVRIEDIDSSRCKDSHTQDIITTLESYGLISEKDIVLQSHRSAFYQQTLDTLLAKDEAFPCNCTRQKLQQQRHTELCEADTSLPHSWRLKSPDTRLSFQDNIQGKCSSALLDEIGHPILKRKDADFSYLLSVVTDDHLQGVTHVVRGMDLLETTAIQIYLFSLLGWQAPQYAHIPLVKNEHQQKLSKQNHAPAIPKGDIETLLNALQYLGIIIKNNQNDVVSILREAIPLWQP